MNRINIFYSFLTNLKKSIVFNLILLFIFFRINETYAAIGYASTGIWSQTTTWTIDGINRTPTCGDTLIILPNVTVTVNSQQNYSACALPIVIYVEGTFQFVNGYKLTLPCNSVVEILQGGILEKTTPGGGNSTFIEICGCAAWQAGMGTITGPDILTCTVLPISLVYFTAESRDDRVSLFWSTATEINNNYFTVERSPDGEIFDPIVNIPGRGNSSVQTDYLFEDIAPLKGITYYRLKQTDFDGRFSYSDIVAVRFRGSQGIELINHFFDENESLNVQFNIINAAPVMVKLYNVYGREIISTIFTSTEGFNSVILPNIFETGNFIFSLSNENSLFTRKIFIVK